MVNEVTKIGWAGDFVIPLVYLKINILLPPPSCLRRPAPRQVMIGDITVRLNPVLRRRPQGYGSISRVQLHIAEKGD